MSASLAFPPKLREYLVARECVAFVGAGFSMPCGMPGWGKLVDQLIFEAEKSVTGDQEAALLKECKEAAAVFLYSTAASRIKSLLSHQELRRCLSDAFALDKLQKLSHDDRQRMLARMENLVLGPWVGIITTNFDTLIESAFDRFPQFSPPFRSDGGQKSLGNVLCLPLGIGKFFVKLHGDAWADAQVLSTTDYLQAWLTSPRIRHFLTAVMLRYRLVFIGCSLEDAILQLRQTLWADFDKALPKAYAFLPDTPANRLRRSELKEEAGLEPLLYPLLADNTDHGAVDEFLRTARGCADLRLDNEGSESADGWRSSALVVQLKAIGAINRHFLQLVSRQERGRLRFGDVFEPYFEQVRQGESRHIFSSLSEGERLYRLLFLVSLGLLDEVVEEQSKYFQASAKLRTHLDCSMLVEEK